jgi:hypothetical protein
MGADCKSAGYAYAGSNPARPIHEKVLNAHFRFGGFDKELTPNFKLEVQN